MWSEGVCMWCVWCICMCRCVACMCMCVSGEKVWMDFSWYKRKLSFSASEAAFLSNKIVLIHLKGLIIMAGSGFICRMCCHLSDLTVTLFSDRLA